MKCWAISKAWQNSLILETVNSVPLLEMRVLGIPNRLIICFFTNETITSSMIHPIGSASTQCVKYSVATTKKFFWPLASEKWPSQCPIGQMAKGIPLVVCWKVASRRCASATDRPGTSWLVQWCHSSWLANSTLVVKPFGHWTNPLHVLHRCLCEFLGGNYPPQCPRTRVTVMSIHAGIGFHLWECNGH